MLIFLKVLKVCVCLAMENVVLDKNIGVGCPALLQGIFLTQESNLGTQQFPQPLYFDSLRGLELGLPTHS